jgi:hypothetical protein
MVYDNINMQAIWKAFQRADISRENKEHLWKLHGIDTKKNMHVFKLFEGLDSHFILCCSSW